MDFSARLDILMCLMGVTNSKLARKLQVDPSLVSRWRNGSRKPTKDHRTIKEISTYLVSQIATNYHLRELAETLNSPDIACMHEDDIVEQVFLWLRSIDDSASMKPASPKSTDAYAGADGRNVVLQALFENFSPKTPNTPVYFYGNDPAELIHKDSLISAEAFEKNPRLFENIGDIRLIINDDATAKEIDAYLSLLLPFLTSGRLSVVQIPHYRKEAFRNSVLIVGTRLAIASNMLSGGSALMANFFTKNTFVSQLTKDFLRIFKQGTPLHTADWNIDFFKILDDSLTLWISDNPVTCVSNALPICTSSCDIITSLVEKADLMSAEKETAAIVTIRDYFIRYEQFLREQECYLLMPLYSIDEVKNGAATMTCLPRFIDGLPLIDENTYLAILKCTLGRLHRYENLVLKIIPKAKHEYALRIQENKHGSIIRNVKPYVNYVSVSPTFVRGFASFIGGEYGDAAELKAQREAALDALQKHIADFEQAIEHGR